MIGSSSALMFHKAAAEASEWDEPFDFQKLVK